MGKEAKPAIVPGPDAVAVAWEAMGGAYVGGWGMPVSGSLSRDRDRDRRCLSSEAMIRWR